MLVRLGRRVLEMGALLFAALGFFSVPLGDRTGHEHLKAILATEPAREAGRALSAALGGLPERLLEPENSAEPESPRERRRARRSSEERRQLPDLSARAPSDPDEQPDASVAWPDP